MTIGKHGELSFDNDVKTSLNRAKHRVIPLSRLKNRPAAGAGLTRFGAPQARAALTWTSSLPP